MKLDGTVTVLCFEDGNVVDQMTFRNLTTTLGKALLAGLARGTGTKVNRLGVGTGSTAAAPADTALGAELTRVALDSDNATANAISYIATFNPGVATGTWRECGLFNNAVAGTMQNRAVFPTPVVKSAGMTIVVVWQLTFN